MKLTDKDVAKYCTWRKLFVINNTIFWIKSYSNCSFAGDILSCYTLYLSAGKSIDFTDKYCLLKEL